MRVWEKSTAPEWASEGVLLLLVMLLLGWGWGSGWGLGLARDALERTTKVVPREVEHRAVPTMKASRAAGKGRY